ncbi:MAG: hypothetical protein GX575_16510 [Candidatus Anammoximicrobium sp.]|nr:hypothetical protein [Candidatus Anammoximicrobium sp.]
MSQEISFWRKVVYVGAIVMLLFPLFWIGQPATPKSAGGVLARLRSENALSQASLGEIDPAGESIKLATLGLRPLAVALLWNKSFEYKKKEDWDGLSATLNQITKLEPNFITVWEHQSHNLSYNVSVEFDDYRMRYHWVTKGIDFLVDGIHLNRENPRLLHYTGWITGQKIGRADEHVQFRELFRKDEDFHNKLNHEIPIDKAHGWDGRPDNWLTGRLWYQRAERAVDAGIPLKGKSPLVFHADNPMSLVNYSTTIEDEGVLGQTAQRSWYEAGEALGEYGRRPIPTSWGHNVRLGEYDQVKEALTRMEQRLEQLAPGVRAQIRQEKIANLTPEQAAALDVPEEKLTDANFQHHMDAVQKTKVTHQEVAQRAPEQNRKAAEKLADRLGDEEVLSSRIAHYRSIVNYDYWTIRCAAEQTKVAVDAREFLYKAKQAYDAAELDEARKLFESSWHAWRKLYDQHPRLLDDISADELSAGIKQYQRLLQQLDEELPADFPLGEILKMRQDRDESLKQMYRQLGTPLSSDADKPEAAKEEPAEAKSEAAKPPMTEAKPEDAARPKPEAGTSKPDAPTPQDTANKPSDAKPAAEKAKPAAEDPKAAEKPKPAG